METISSKAQARSHARNTRRTIHGHSGHDASQAAVTHGLAAINEIWADPSPGIVAGYLAVGSELDAGPLMTALEKLGWSLALPVVVAPDTPLLFRHWRQGDDLGVGPFGIGQPGEQASVARPHVVLAPLLAYDDEGFRLGQGGGFYDRTLALWRTEGHAAIVLGLAFAAQRLDAVPRDHHDQRLDGIINEQEFKVFGK